MTSQLTLMRHTPGWGALGDVRPWTANPPIGAGVNHRISGTRVPITTFGSAQYKQENDPAFAATYQREEPR